MAAYKYPRDRRVRRRPADDRHRQDPQARTCSWRRSQAPVGSPPVTAAGVAEVATAGHRPRRSTVVLGLAVLAAGLGVALLAHRVVPAVGVLTWAVGLGVVAANLNLLPRAGRAATGR